MRHSCRCASGCASRMRTCIPDRRGAIRRRWPGCRSGSPAPPATGSSRWSICRGSRCGSACCSVTTANGARWACTGHVRRSVIYVLGSLPLLDYARGAGRLCRPVGCDDVRLRDAGVVALAGAPRSGQLVLVLLGALVLPLLKLEGLVWSLCLLHRHRPRRGAVALALARRRGFAGGAGLADRFQRASSAVRAASAGCAAARIRSIFRSSARLRWRGIAMPFRNCAQPVRAVELAFAVVVRAD